MHDLDKLLLSTSQDVVDTHVQTKMTHEELRYLTKELQFLG